MPTEFRPSLIELINDRKEAMADGVMLPSEVCVLLADANKIIESSLRGVAGDDDAFNSLVEDVEWAVQTYIVPIDLTQYRVPAMFERFVVDPQLVPSVRPALMALREKVRSNKPAATEEGVG